MRVTEKLLGLRWRQEMEKTEISGIVEVLVEVVLGVEAERGSDGEAI